MTTKASIAILTAALVVAGTWVTGMAAPDVAVHGLLLAAWIALLSAAAWRATRDRRSARRAALGGVAVTLVVVLAAGAWLSRPKTVDEDIVVADAEPATETTPAPDAPAQQAPAPKNTLVAEGSFESLAHETRGTAKVIRLADGSSKLTLSGFSTDAGPDLFVYAVAGDPQGDDDVRDYVDLGSLKGNEGNQQYDLPDDFDATKYAHVYIWCRAFTVGFGRAALASA